MADEDVERCALNPDGRRLLDLAVDRLSLTATAVTQTLKVARTVADLDASEALRPAHLAEALQYRRRPLCRAATSTNRTTPVSKP